MVSYSEIEIVKQRFRKVAATKLLCRNAALFPSCSWITGKPEITCSAFSYAVTTTSHGAFTTLTNFFDVVQILSFSPFASFPV
jgi:hypothetical protein